MKINFVTSGFPDVFTDEFITELKKHLISCKSFVFVASDFRAHDRTKHYHDKFLRLFADKGIEFEQSFIVDYEIKPDEAVRLIKSADVVWLAGGNTLIQIKHIKEYGLIPALIERNGITIGMSAGSINMAQRVVLARDDNDNIPELSVYDGIGLINFNVEPHLNEASAGHIEEIKEASKISPIYGLYDESFIEETNGEMKIFGKYRLF